MVSGANPTIVSYNAGIVKIWLHVRSSNDFSFAKTTFDELGF
jgi:hypothetical protein